MAKVSVYKYFYLMLQSTNADIVFVEDSNAYKDNPFEEGLPRGVKKTIGMNFSR